MPEENRWQPEVRERRYSRRKELGLTRLVSEGDSWFDYPPHTNVVDYIDDTELFAVKRFEASSDTLHNMVATVEKVAEAVRNEVPQCVLLSAGGNDVLEQGFIGTLFKEFDANLTPREHLVPEVWQRRLDQIERDFVLLMHALGDRAPIMVHGYDYMPPSDKAAKYDGFRVSGPWVLPSMLERKIKKVQFQRDIVKEMINDFNDILARLQKQYPLNYIHVDLRGMFEVEDWLNEIHLKKSGFKRVAKQFTDAIKNRLPAVLKARKDAGL